MHSCGTADYSGRLLYCPVQSTHLISDPCIYFPLSKPRSCTNLQSYTVRSMHSNLTRLSIQRTETAAMNPDHTLQETYSMNIHQKRRSFNKTRTLDCCFPMKKTACAPSIPIFKIVASTLLYSTVRYAVLSVRKLTPEPYFLNRTSAIYPEF